MNPYDERVLAEAVNRVAPILPLGEGGKQKRGPNRTADFLYQVWVEKALIQTQELPAMLEMERQKYLEMKKLLEDVGRKGQYTSSYGWSPDKGFLWDFNISRPVYQYFAVVVGPFLGFGKGMWHNEGSRLWKRIKKMIISGDKVRITKFAKDIERKLMKERAKRIMGAVDGTKDTSTSAEEVKPTSSIQ